MYLLHFFLIVSVLLIMTYNIYSCKRFDEYKIVVDLCLQTVFPFVEAIKRFYVCFSAAFSAHSTKLQSEMLQLNSAFVSRNLESSLSLQAAASSAMLIGLDFFIKKDK